MNAEQIFTGAMLELYKLAILEYDKETIDLLIKKSYIAGRLENVSQEPPMTEHPAGAE